MRGHYPGLISSTVSGGVCWRAGSVSGPENASRVFPESSGRSRSRLAPDLFMPVLRYPALVWRDAAGFHTAVLVEADDERLAGFGRLGRRRPRSAARQPRMVPPPGRPPRTASDFLDPQLGVVKVKVRPEYHVGKLLHACDEMTLPVHCVSGRQASGLLVAALPFFGVRFTYHEAGRPPQPRHALRPAGAAAGHAARRGPLPAAAGRAAR